VGIKLKPACDNSYTTHAMSPAAVLQVFREIRQQEPPPSFTLSIRGWRFQLGDDLSPEANANLEAALSFADRLCANPDPGYWLALAASAVVRPPKPLDGRLSGSAA